MEQADLNLVVVDCAHLPPDTQQAAAFLQRHLTDVLPTETQPERGMTSVRPTTTPQISWTFMMYTAI